MERILASLGGCPLPLKFTIVSVLGFGTDAVVLHVLTQAGVSPAWARVVSLLSAMQMTFLINGLVVFRCLDLARPWSKWAAYMLAHGLGNICNYWIFLGLLSLRRPVSEPIIALAMASVTAWVINYGSARYLVFRRARALTEPVTSLSVPFPRVRGRA